MLGAPSGGAAVGVGLALLLSAALAQETSGFAELRVQAMPGVDATVPLMVVERLRPTFSADLAPRVLLSTTIEAGLNQGFRTRDAAADLLAANGLSPDLAAALGASESENALLGISSARDYLSVDRLYVDWYTAAADVRVGRQALNWGSAFAVNPSAPFPEVIITEPWKPRSGINAVRVDIPLGELSAVQLVAASDDVFLHPRLAAKVTANHWQTDWSLVGAWREEVGEGVLGVDIKGTLGVGFWVEGVMHVGSALGAYEEVAAGLDYSFPVLESFVVTAQYYRNGSGSPAGGSLSLLAPRQAFAPPYSGRDYLMAAVSAGLVQDVSASVFWMQNLNDGTAFVVPSVTTFPTEQWELSLVAQVPLSFSADGGEFKPSAAALLVPLPAADGSVVDVDFSGLVPAATLILWTRYNF